MTRLGRVLPPLLLILLAGVTWELYVDLAHVPDYILPGPLGILRAAVNEHDLLLQNAVPTFQIAVFGMVGRPICPSWDVPCFRGSVTWADVPARRLRDRHCPLAGRPTRLRFPNRKASPRAGIGRSARGRLVAGGRGRRSEV